MNKSSQWLFEAPMTLEKSYSHPELELAWDFLDNEYIPSSVRQAFENAVKVGNWKSAYLNLNGLSMYEMLRALNALAPQSLNALWANRISFVSMVNMSRIDYARKVVLNRVLPPPIGDLQRTGQVRDAINFIAEHPCKRKPKQPNLSTYCNVGEQVACPPPTGLNEAEMTALKITTRFENNTEFGCRVSQVDGISMGMIQWNLAAGTLQKMLNDFEALTGRLRDFFGADTEKLKALIAMPNRDAVKIATSERLCFRWSSAFLRLCADPQYCRLQTTDIIHRIKKCLKVTKRLGLRTIRGLCIIFDVDTGDNISQKKEQAFLNRIKELSTEREKLVVIADEAARWAGKWEVERRQRRMLIAQGTGCYRGQCQWNLNQDYPNLDNLLQN